MADVTIGARLTADGSQAIATVGEFKKALKEAKSDLLSAQNQYGEFSNEALDAAKKVANLNAQLKDANDLAASFNPERKFIAFGNAVQGVVGGFSALQGAMGLFGAEGQELEKTMLKVQSAMALTQGLDAFRESIGDFKNLGAVIKNQVVAAFTTLKGAIAATGIGLLVVALGTIASYWDDIKAAVTGVSGEQKKLLETAKQASIAEEEKLSALDDQSNVLRMQGKSEREILNLKIAQIDAVIKAKAAEMEAQKGIVQAQIEADRRNRLILKGVLDFVTKPLQLLIDGVAKVASVFGADLNFNIADSVSKMVFDEEATRKDGEKTLAEMDKQLSKLKNQKAGFQLEVQAIDKAASDKRLEELKKAHDKEVEFQKQVTQDLLKEKQDREARFKDFEAQLQKDKIAELDAERKREADAKALRDQNIQNEYLAVKQAMAAVAADETLSVQMREQLINQSLQNVLNSTAYSEAQKLAVEKAAAEARMALSEAEKNVKINNLMAVSNTLGAIGDLVGKQTAVGKGLAAAAAIINTYQGATKALAQGGIFGFIGAAAVIASGLKSVNEILKTKIPGQSSGSGLPSSVTAQPTQAPLRPTTTTTQLDQASINAVGNAAGARAYVVESDINNGKERTERLNRAARLS